MEFGPVVLIRRGCSVADYLIGDLDVTEVEQLAGKHTPLAPPLVGILPPQLIVGHGDHQPGGFGNPIVAKEPMNAAERIPKVLAYFAWNLLEQRARLAFFRHNRGAGLDDGGIGTA